MGDPFANYDSWLERPYQDMYDETDKFLDWCEANDVDPDDPEAENLYMSAQDVFEDDYCDYDDDEEEEGW